jgi:phosphoribosyl 1,2-cyclic phosphate phosphodiesterase
MGRHRGRACAYDRTVKAEILGSGAATTTPRPGCACRVCVEARERGAPYARTGPCVFVHGPDLVFDTPEEAKLQLDRPTVGEIAGCFYSHWHPDHTMGRRAWETRNGDFLTWPREAKRHRVTDVYLPQQVAADFHEYLGAWDHLEFMAERGYIRVHTLSDGDTVRFGDVSVRPFRLEADYVYAFELSDGERRLLLAMDELVDWRPSPELRGCDLAVLPMGICEHDPLTGARLIPADHPILRYEATFPETLEMVDALEPGAVVLMHVEEIHGLSHDDLQELGGRLRADGRPVTFAWDGLTVDV